MEQVVYFSADKTISERVSDLKNRYRIVAVHSLRDAVLYIIHHPDVAFVIYSVSSAADSHESTLEVISRLNAVLPILVLGYEFMGKFNVFAGKYKSVILVKDSDRLSNVVDKVIKNRRIANRVNWPLSAIFYQANDPDHFDHGLVLSLSTKGAFVKTTDFDLLNHESILLEIHFEDFSFLVEGRIVRVQKSIKIGSFPGFAVEFINVTPATFHCIETLVNDKLLSLFIGKGENEESSEAKAGQIIKFD